MIKKTIAALALVCGTLVGIAPTATAQPSQTGCESRNNNTYSKLLECVRVEGVREHQAAFQAIADANGDTRVSGSPGYDQSVEYAAGVFEAAGYEVTKQAFQFQTFITLSPTELQRITPLPGPVATNIFSYSGSGNVTASVYHVPNDGSAGCEPGDFAGFIPGTIALISRGGCTFAIKATNAWASGAVGVIIYNNAPGTINGTLGNGFSLDIPVTSVTQDVGLELASLPGLIMQLKTDTFRGIATTENVIAETPGGNPDNVVMVGAHLDSVNAGPGINDNGSGSAAILEVAESMQKLKPQNKVRFALWGAEESGLVGSTYYVNNLTPAERDDIALYLNFDMIGSPNHIIGVYDGDESGFAAPVGVPIPEGSIQIEDAFESFFTSIGEPYADAQFSGRSDYQAFINNGIPAGGLFTGAEGIKTTQQAAIWGGVAGEQYDQCYHLACDTYDNNSDHALDVNSDAIAFLVLRYAYSTQEVNGVAGKKVPGNYSLPAPAGPQSTVN